MLGDCYAAAVVEHLSRKELMALDAAAYQVMKFSHLWDKASLFLLELFS